MNQTNALKIIIDNRERKLIKLLETKFPNIDFELKQLDIADIVISEDVAIERKEGFDFVASLVDNRLLEQCMRLKEAYTTPILVLEGLNDNVFENTGVKIASIYGVLSKISYKLGIAVIPTRNLDDTAIVIERIAYREQIKDGASILSRKAPKSMSLEERRTFIVEGFVDIGPKKAKSLIEKYETPYHVFKAIKHTEITYTRTGNPKGIEGPLKDLSGFSWKFVEKNKEMLFGKTKEKGPVQKKIDDI
jgi:ERCC4-type nuclease